MNTTVFSVPNYNLDVTFSCGQAFRWHCRDGGWEGVIDNHWVRLESRKDGISAATDRPQTNWRWLEDYLQLHADLDAIVATFPQDEPMRASVQACNGMRLLRQNPWETLVCFICSATKQIVQIRQIIHNLCQQFGEPVAGSGGGACRAFPTFSRLALAGEEELRACKMGFRAPHVLAAARKLDSGAMDLGRIASLPLDEARDCLTQLNGVGPKIADCVLLFAYGFPKAFPVDVWIRRALEHLYFRGRSVRPERLNRFIETHFGPWSGYAQQYLFHAVRTGALPLPKPKHA